jgi:hypothetical protein
MEWIKTDNAEPKYEGKYLVFTDIVETAWYIDEHDGYVFCRHPYRKSPEIIRPKFWMPLPSPPKE